MFCWSINFYMTHIMMSCKRLKWVQAVRFNNWKAVRYDEATGKNVELYDLEVDVGEKNDISAQNQDVVSKIEGFMEQAHVDDPNWPIHNCKTG
jgi:hypothetical protein